MSGKENVLQLKPPPPPTLSKELLGIWSAWTRTGDREVVREAVVKGNYIEWAYMFLAARKELDDDEVKKWFKDEVFVWVTELLGRHQIFKASHVLTNLKLDPTQEFTRIFTETYNKGLRNFLGSHLVKCEQLDPSLKEAWLFLEILLNHNDVLKETEDQSVNFNIHSLWTKSLEWKCDIATLLFLKTYDAVLKPFVTADNVWKYLLKHKRADLIKLWIEICFAHNIVVSPNVPEALIGLFAEFPVTDAMIDLLFEQALKFPTETRQILLNELGKYGVFKTHEKGNVQLILKRVINGERLNSLHDILNGENSRITLNQFNELLIKFCIDHNLFSVLNYCTIDYKAHCDFIQKSKCKFLDLISYLKGSNEISLGDNILKIAQFLADDLQNYFSLNPLIFLAVLMLLYSDNDLFQLFKADTVIILKDIEIDPQTTRNILAKLPFLNQIINPSSKSITYYDLLKTHCSLNTDVFDFGLKNGPIPNFNSNSLVQKYGYTKRMNYLFYLKQARPSFAAKFYLLDRLKNDSSSDPKAVHRKVFKIVTQNFLNKEITVSCVAFLEMIGQSSYNLRIYINAANIFFESGIYSFEEIKDLLQNVSENPVCFLENLERVLMGRFLSPGYTNFDLVEAIRKQEIAVQFSQIHNLRLPELFLEYCAKSNYWLAFLVFIQRHNYPLEQVQKLICGFKSTALAEHLYHGLTHDIQIDEKKDLLMRDTRKLYLSRIGVRQTIDTTNVDGVQSSLSSYGSGSSSSSSDLFESDMLEFKTDLLQILIKCHNSIDPPKALLRACFYYKNPIYAVLATSYEPDSIISNWFTWLLVSCGVENEFSNIEGGVLTATLVTQLLNAVVQKSFNKILLESFLIFLPENPLRLFVDFLINCMDLNFDRVALRGKLKRFQRELLKKHCNAVIMDVDYEMLFLKNKVWIETSAIELCCTSLHHNYKSQYNQLRFLKFLHEIEIANFFTTRIPDFLKYYKIINSLFEHKCDIRLNLSVISDKDLINQELLYCVDKLLSHEQYKCAFEIAKLAGFSTDLIVINEWHYKFENRSDCNEFWNLCDRKFHEVGIQPNIAIDFLEKCATETNDKIEKYKILNLAHKWALFCDWPNLYNIEKKLWLSFFEIENKIMDRDLIKLPPQKLLFAEMQQKLELFKNDNDSTLVSNEENIAHLDKSICRLLNLGDLWQALKLAKIFKYKQHDLELVTLCCSLAESLIMPYQLTTEQRLLLNKQTSTRTLSHRRRRTLMSSKGFSSFCSGSSPGATTMVHVIDQVDTPFRDTLTALETLSECVKVGVDIVQNVLLVYRIALNIEKSYQEVFMCIDSMHMLNEALKSGCTNKLEVVSDFIALYKWTNEQIADFLCDELTTAIRDQIELQVDPLIMWNINLDTDFHSILQLLNENCSTLGLKLYMHASNLHKIQSQSSAELEMCNVELAIDLLIRAHDCFTADCNMEGISIILRKCHSIISLLLTVKAWKLMVRLLTGVARYTEMNYVFHIIRENDEFEFLLRKGIRKDSGLKTALLKYLRKYCPKDIELYRMVALHFSLYSEVALLWEEDSKGLIKHLVSIARLEMQNYGLNLEGEPFVLLRRSEATTTSLNKIIINYTHATEYHLQGEKLAKAMNSAKQAELVALQMSTVCALITEDATTICLLNLKEAQIATLISRDLPFSQALILIEAYNYKADWASVLFEQYVMRSNIAYLEGFLGSLILTDTIINDISRKFLGLKAISDSTTKNMKEIVKLCSSVSMKYRIASELGFSDLIEELLAGNQLAFIKDTVWKKGYKS